MIAAPVGVLETQGRSLDSPLPVPNVSGLYGISFDGQSYQVDETQLQAARTQFRSLVSQGLRRVESRIVGGREGHRYLEELRADQWAVSRISGLFGRVDFPDLSIWDQPDAYLREAQWALKSTKANPLGRASAALEKAEAASAEAAQKVIDYREGSISGAGRAVTTLEITRDVSFAATAIIATILTGGTAGALIGAGVTATGQAAQQGMEVSLGLRQKIDWAGIGFDAVVGIVTSKFGGKLGNAVAGRVLGNPAVAGIGRKAITKLVDDLVSGSASTVFHMTARNIFDNARGASSAMTMEQFIGALAHSLTDPRSIFMNILSGEAARRGMAKAGARPSAPHVEVETPPAKTAAPVPEAPPAGAQVEQTPTQRPADTPVPAVSTEAPAVSQKPAAVGQEAPFVPQDLPPVVVPDVPPEIASRPKIEYPSGLDLAPEARGQAGPESPYGTVELTPGPDVEIDVGRTSLAPVPDMPPPPPDVGSGLETNPTYDWRATAPETPEPSPQVPSGLETNAGYDWRATAPDTPARPPALDTPSGIETQAGGWTGQGELPAFGLKDLGPTPTSTPKVYRGKKKMASELVRRKESFAEGPGGEEVGTPESRTGMHYGEYNAAEMMQGLRISRDSNGFTKKVTYRVDADTSGREVQTERSFSKDVATEGPQSTNAAFEGTGLEKGHMGQREAFKGYAEAELAADQMTNVVPMTEKANRGKGSPWRASEANTIGLADEHGSVTVEVEPHWDAKPKRLSDGTPIPSKITRRIIAPDGKVLEEVTVDNT